MASSKELSREEKLHLQALADIYRTPPPTEEIGTLPQSYFQEIKDLADQEARKPL